MIIIEFIFATVTGLIFVSSSGHLFRTRHNENKTIILVTGLLAVLSTVLLVVQLSAWVISYYYPAGPTQSDSKKGGKQGDPATNALTGNVQPEGRSNASIPSPQTVEVHPIGESPPANDEAQNWSIPLSLSLTSDIRVDVSESASDVLLRLVTKGDVDPTVSVDVDQNRQVDNNLDYNLGLMGLRPNLSSAMETVHGEDSYARKVYGRHVTIYNHYQVPGGFSFTPLDPDMEEFKWIAAKSALSLNGQSARLIFRFGRGKPRVEKTIYFGIQVPSETVEQFRQKHMSGPVQQFQGP